MSAITREQIFSNSYIMFNETNPQITGEPDETLVLFEDPATKFGILYLKLNETPINAEEKTLDSINDISGSMAQVQTDGNTKQDHANHTLKNIMNLLATPEYATETNVKVNITGFDDKIEQVVINSKPTEDILVMLTRAIDIRLKPRGGTNIEMALKTLQQIEKGTTILTTDGDANLGVTDYNELAKLVNPNTQNYFIGFGSDHKSVGLKKLANSSVNGKYYFVPSMEETGNVFGEIIHEMLYAALKDITITITNGKIYDSKTNTWSTSIFIPLLVSDCERKIHVCSSDIENVTILISAISPTHGETIPTLIQEVDVLPELENPETLEIMFGHELHENMIRHRIMELLARATDLMENEDKPFLEIKELKSILKIEISQHLNFINKFMVQNDLMENDNYKTMCNDLIICLKTYESPVAHMYSASRQASLAEQRAFSVNINENDMQTERHHGIPRHHGNGIQRQHAYNFDGEEPEPEADDPMLTAFRMTSINATNSTPRQANIMRACSST